jgi:hypothetical protein
MKKLFSRLSAVLLAGCLLAPANAVSVWAGDVTASPDLIATEAPAVASPTAAPTAAPTASFSDVTPADWFYDDVNFVVSNGYMTGLTDDTFGPETPVDRATVADALYAMAGSPAVSDTVPAGLTDVDASDPAIIWAVENSVVSPADSTHFDPSGTVTREQMAQIMFNYATYEKAAPTGSWAVRLDYADVDQISDSAMDAALYCYMKNILVGEPGKLFVPQGITTRAQAAAMLHRLSEAVVPAAN